MSARDHATETGPKSPGLASPPPMSAGSPAATDDDRAVGISPFWVRASLDMLEEERFHYVILPLKREIDAYVEQGTVGGYFITSLLVGDYAAAIGQADAQNRWLIPIYHEYLHACVDPALYGSAEKVARHIMACRAQQRRTDR